VIRTGTPVVTIHAPKVDAAGDERRGGATGPLAAGSPRQDAQLGRTWQGSAGAAYPRSRGEDETWSTTSPRWRSRT
jgi:hypothetical protein